METRGGKGRGGGREGEGDGGIVFAASWILGDKVTIAVVSLLSRVLLWRKLLSSMVGKHEAGPVPI